MNEQPSIEILEWGKWLNYGECVKVDAMDVDWDQNLDYPGVYVLAHFKTPPPTPDRCPHLHEEVVYIGETKNIRKRPKAHNKIGAYKELTGDSSLDHLYVAVYKIENWFWTTGPQKDALRDLQANMIKEYAVNYGARPPLNKRDRG